MGEGNGNGNGNGRLRLTFDQLWKIAVLLIGIGAFVARTEMNQTQTKEAVETLQQTMIDSNRATAAEMAKLAEQNRELLAQLGEVKRRLPRTRWRSEGATASGSTTARTADELEPWQ